VRGRRPDLSLPVHPLLAAAYPVVFLFASNVADQVTLEPLWLPLAAVVVAAGVLTLVLWALFRDPWRAGLLATLLVTLFLWHGHAWNVAGATLGSTTVLGAIWIGIALVGAVIVARAGAWRRQASAFLNVVTAVLVGVNVLQIAAYTTGTAVAAGEPQPSASVPAELPEHRPDIYYLVFDRYASADVLREHYGFDNTPFLDALRERGFFVADDARANYPKTPLSLVSSLSMDYLDGEDLSAEATAGNDAGPIHRRLRGALRVPLELQRLGYSHVHIANWWEPSATSATADVVHRHEAASEFTSAVIRMSALSAFGAGAEGGQYDRPVLREHTRFQFRVLGDAGADPGPQFVFAHFLVPHPPYVFHADGSFVETEPTGTEAERVAYVEQMKFTNARILEVLDRLLAVPEADRPIILLQADEGPFPARYDANEYRFDWRTATPEELDEKFGILSAYHLPGVEPESAGLYPAITPVNSFRVVFDAYFGTDLGLLPDRVFAHRSQYHFYDFIEVTDAVSGAAVASTARSASAIGRPPDDVMPSWKARSASVSDEP
jgi:hypothetical protein